MTLFALVSSHIFFVHILCLTRKSISPGSAAQRATAESIDEVTGDKASMME